MSTVLLLLAPAEAAPLLALVLLLLLLLPHAATANTAPVSSILRGRFSSRESPP